MVTSWREPDGRKDWFTTAEAGIQVHWLPVPYSNHMSYNQRIASFFQFAWGAAHKAASLPADVVLATSTPLTIALPGVYAARRQKVPMVFEVRGARATHSHGRSSQPSNASGSTALGAVCVSVIGRQRLSLYRRGWPKVSWQQDSHLPV